MSVCVCLAFGNSSQFLATEVGPLVWTDVTCMDSRDWLPFLQQSALLHLYRGTNITTGVLVSICPEDISS